MKEVFGARGLSFQFNQFNRNRVRPLYHRRARVALAEFMRLLPYFGAYSSTNQAFPIEPGR